MNSNISSSISSSDPGITNSEKEIDLAGVEVSSFPVDSFSPTLEIIQQFLKKESIVDTSSSQNTVVRERNEQMDNYLLQDIK